MTASRLIIPLLSLALGFQPDVASARRRAVRPALSADFFVSTNGCDSCGWSGMLASPNTSNTDGPFATISRAQQAVQTLKATRASGAITVMVRGGTYWLRAPLTFGAP